MTWLTENPTAPLWGIGLCIVLLGVVLYQTQRLAVLMPIGALLLLAIAACAADHFVVTPREEIEQALHDLAGALETNDLERVVGFIAAEKTDELNDARRVLSQVEIHSAEIKVKLSNIRVDAQAEPPTATAEFIASVTYDAVRAGVSDGRYIGRFTIDCRREEDRWIVTDYRVRPLIGAGYSR